MTFPKSHRRSRTFLIPVPELRRRKQDRHTSRSVNVSRRSSYFLICNASYAHAHVRAPAVYPMNPVTSLTHAGNVKNTRCRSPLRFCRVESRPLFYSPANGVKNISGRREQRIGIVLFSTAKDRLSLAHTITAVVSTPCHHYRNTIYRP